MKRIILILVVLLSYIACSGSTADLQFQKANDLYSQKNFVEAAKIYESLLKTGYKSSELYYNLGNSYFRLNKISNSILNFEKAKKLAPTDEDINFNLRIANMYIVDKIEPVDVFFLTKWYNSLSGSFSSSGWAWTAVGMSWILVLSIALFIIFPIPLIRKSLFAIQILSVILIIFSMIFTFKNYAEETTNDTAIIYSPSVYIKSSPDNNGNDLFILHEGTKVKILDEVGQWKKVRIANGNAGWMQGDMLKVI